MPLKTALERHKRWIVPTFLVIAIVGAGYSIWNVLKSDISTQPISSLYFTDDDGKSYFEDAASRAFPFDHGGKQAYRAYVFRCGENGKPFVGVVGRQVSVAGAAVNAQYKSDSRPPAVEICRPGTGKWVAFTSRDAAAMFASLCPDGRPQSVVPGE